MRLRIRFFLVFLLFSIALLAALAVVGRVTFERGIDQYMGQRQQALLNNLALDFGEYYQRNGSFVGIRLRALIRAQEGGEDGPALPPGLILTAADGEQLFGPDVERRSRKVPIEAEGETVGWLSLAADADIRDAMTQRFQRRQLDMLTQAILPALLLAILASWLVSRQLVRPLEVSATLAGTLARGDYDARLDLNRKDELGALADSLNSLAVNLKQARHARERWLAAISHELRTPVAVLQAELEALIDGVRPADPAHLASLHQETRHLSRLLDDLHQLALSDAGALRYEFQPLCLPSLVSETAGRMQGHLADAGLTLHQHLPAPSASGGMQVLGDPTRLQQLLENLLTNSLRYTNAPGEVHLTLTVVERQLQLTLEDSPPGVDDATLEALFQPFYRAHNATHRLGSGLGLAICQRIVQAHRGEIRADHSSLGGLKITITLPLGSQQ